jgi:hypothetical protein
VATALAVAQRQLAGTRDAGVGYFMVCLVWESRRAEQLCPFCREYARVGSVSLSSHTSLVHCLFLLTQLCRLSCPRRRSVRIRNQLIMPAFQVFGIAYKSVVFIGAVTTIYAVTYDNHSVAFATNLMFFVDMKS